MSIAESVVIANGEISEVFADVEPQKIVVASKRTGKCRYWKDCKRHSNVDYYCNKQAGYHGVDLTQYCRE